MLYDIILPEHSMSFASCDLWLCDLCHLTVTLVLKIENRSKIKIKIKIKNKKEK